MNASIPLRHLQSIARGLSANRALRLSRRMATQRVSKESSAVSVHHEIEGVLGKSNSPASDPTLDDTIAMINAANQKARYNQALFNMGVAFFALLLAWQVNRTAKLKKKVERELELVAQQLEERQSLLCALQSEDFVGQLADKCLDDLLATHPSQEVDRNWRGILLGNQRDRGNSVEIDEMTRSTIASTLTRELARFIGKSALPETEKRQKEVTSLDQDTETLLAIVEAATDDKNVLQELENIQISEDESGATVIKKRVFSI